MKIVLDKFGGLLPGIAPHLLPEHAAQTAMNCKLLSGALRAWKEPLETATLAKAGTIQGLYFYENQYWFHWLNAVQAVKGPLASDAWKRVYFCDSGPKMTANDVALTGGDHPAVSYDLGVPIPTSAMAAAIGGTPTSSDPTDNEARAYVFTYLTKYGEESAPSPSVSINVMPGEHVDLSSIPLAPAGNTVITQKRIYRTNTGSSDTDYQLVATIAVATTTYQDTKTSAQLGIVLESAEYNPPPTDLAGLIVLPNGSLCGYSGTEVCFSEPYRPHAWPLRYRIPVENTIKAVGAFANMVLVTTTGLPYLIVGETPGAMSRDKLEIGQACASSRGMVDMGYSLLYPGADGLIQIGQGKFENVTEKIMTRDEWQAYTPSTIHAYLWGGKYLAFYNNGAAGAFLFDPEALSLTHLSITATGGCSDPATGNLYLVVGDKVKKFDAGATALSYTWKSKPFITTPTNFGAARVYADSYPLTLKLYADGSLKHTQSVTSAEPFRLPGGYQGRKWELQLEGTTGVNMALLANTVSEIAQ